MAKKETKKQYSCGSLIPPLGRHVKVEYGGQDLELALYRIGKRVAASQRGRVPNNAHEDGPVFSGRSKTLKK